MVLHFALISAAASITLLRRSFEGKGRMSDLDRWETRFSAPGYWFGTAPNAFLASQAHRLAPGQTALAIADGEGRNGVWLAEQGLDVLTIDFSPSAASRCAPSRPTSGNGNGRSRSSTRSWRSSFSSPIRPCARRFLPASGRR